MLHSKRQQQSSISCPNLRWCYYNRAEGVHCVCATLTEREWHKEEAMREKKTVEDDLEELVAQYANHIRQMPPSSMRDSEPQSVCGPALFSCNMTNAPAHGPPGAIKFPIEGMRQPVLP
jgi:hypothetical protein